MSLSYEELVSLKDEFQKKHPFSPEIGIVLGSGLDSIVDQIEIEEIIPYQEIPGMPVSTNKMHKGQFVLGTLDGVKVMVMQGRLHLYEGYEAKEVVTPHILMKLLGVKGVILTNACGAVNLSYHPGEFMLIEDHICFEVESPLKGPNMDKLTTRFPDMSDIYSKEITNCIEKEAKKASLPVHKGVFMQFVGPQFETKAEIKMARTLGADAVGMSTAIEALMLSAMGVKTVALSVLTNMACGILEEKLSDEDVIRISKQSKEPFEKLLRIALKELKQHC